MENYFNYFTEVEEQFRRCRAEPVLLSPLDWALVESWKEQGFPLEAVLAGIERTFEKHQAKQRKYRKVNSLAYCSQEIFRAVEETRTNSAQTGTAMAAETEAAPFSGEELSRFFARGAAALALSGERARADGKQVLADELGEAAAALRDLGARTQAQPARNLETVETSLTALEERLNASLQRGTAVEVLAQIRTEVDRSLVPYRRKLPAAEVDLLERRFLKNRLLEHYQIPRLSLFYL